MMPTPAEAHFFLNQLWQESGEIMWICQSREDGDFILDEFNQAERDLFGDFVHQGMSLRSALGDIFDSLTDGYRVCLRSGKAENFRQVMNIEGMTRHFSVCLIPVPQPAGNALPRIWGIAREITNLVEAQAQMTRYNQILESKVAERTATLYAANLELQKLSNTDPLTGISNRRHFMAEAAKEIERARRHGTDLALLWIDLDKFKQINDGYGHETGDIVLQRFARTVATALREIDVFARVGGDEFAVLLPHASETAAEVLAARIVSLLPSMATDQHPELPQVSASIGMSCLMESDPDIDAVMKRADVHLYQAKSSVDTPRG